MTSNAADIPLRICNGKIKHQQQQTSQERSQCIRCIQAEVQGLQKAADLQVHVQLHALALQLTCKICPPTSWQGWHAGNNVCAQSLACTSDHALLQ